MLPWIYASAIACVSLAAFFVYGADKRRAQAGKRRISERALLGLSLLGGAAGGIAAMWICRHKIRKWYFHVLNAAGLLWQAAVLAALFL